MKRTAEALRECLRWVWERFCSVWLWMMKWYQRLIIAPDSKSLCDHYETLQSDESVFYLKQKNRAEEKTEGKRERQSKISDERAWRDEEEIKTQQLWRKKKKRWDRIVKWKKWVVTCSPPPFHLTLFRSVPDQSLLTLIMSFSPILFSLQIISHCSLSFPLLHI